MYSFKHVYSNLNFICIAMECVVSEISIFKAEHAVHSYTALPAMVIYPIERNT